MLQARQRIIRSLMQAAPATQGTVYVDLAKVNGEVEVWIRKKNFFSCAQKAREHISFRIVSVIMDTKIQKFWKVLCSLMM